VELDIRPEPEPPVRSAIEAALALAIADDRIAPQERSAWRRADAEETKEAPEQA
jgi:hypothetical protein